MSDAHDPAALVRHAVQAGDWRLVELIARMLAGASTERSRGARGAPTSTLVVKLGLASDSRQLRSRLMEEIERARRGVPRRHPQLRLGRRHPARPDRGDRRHPRRAARARRRGPREAHPAHPSSATARRSRACCYRRSVRSGSTPRRPGSGRRGAGSRSPTSSATGGFTGMPSAASSAAQDRSNPTRRRLASRAPAG